MNKFVITALCLASINAYASPGMIVNNATVTKVSSTSGNQDAFWVLYTTESNSNDKCSGKVKFQSSFSGTEKTFDRAFTLATTALVAGKPIDIFSYTDSSDCSSAVSIDLNR
jgi:hypothetical protein